MEGGSIAAGTGADAEGEIAADTIDRGHEGPHDRLPADLWTKPEPPDRLCEKEFQPRVTQLLAACSHA